MHSEFLIFLMGSLAGTCTTISFIPQLFQIIKTKSAEDISTGMFLIFALGSFLWFSYGILTNAWPVIIANAITFCLDVSILFLKWKYSRVRVS